MHSRTQVRNGTAALPKPPSVLQLYACEVASERVPEAPMTVQAALAAMKLLSPLRVVLCRCRVRGRARGGNAARGRARPGGVPYKCGGVVLGKTALEREIEKSHQKGARSTKHFLGENIRLLTTVTDRRAKNSRIAGAGRPRKKRERVCIEKPRTDRVAKTEPNQIGTQNPRRGDSTRVNYDMH